MGAENRYARRIAGQSWLSTLLGVFVLVAGGFALGLVVGVISEEPELVVGHVAGRTTEIEWSAAGDGVEPIGENSADWPTADDGSVVASDDSPARGLPPVAAPAAPQMPAADRNASNVRAGGTNQVAAHSPVQASGSTRGDSQPAPAAGDSSSTFAIQVGAFGDSKAAQNIAGRLRAGGYPVQVVPPATDDRWRVRVGPIRSRVEADETAERLKVEENLPTWVLRENLP